MAFSYQQRVEALAMPGKGSNFGMAENGPMPSL